MMLRRKGRRAWILREAYLYDSAKAFMRGSGEKVLPCLWVGWLDGVKGYDGRKVSLSGGVRARSSSSVWI